MFPYAKTVYMLINRSIYITIMETYLKLNSVQMSVSWHNFSPYYRETTL